MLEKTAFEAIRVGDEESGEMEVGRRDPEEEGIAKQGAKEQDEERIFLLWMMRVIPTLKLTKILGSFFVMRGGS